MDLNKLLEHQQELYLFMEHRAYSECYINKFRNEIKWISNRHQSEKWTSYTDIYRTHESISHSKDALNHLRSIIGKLEYFDMYGSFPDGTRKNFLIRKDRYHFLSDEYKEFIDFFRNSEGKRGKRRSTIYRESESAIQYLHYMMNCGFSNLHDITEESTLSFFFSEEDVTRNTCYRGKIVTVFKIGQAWSDECGRILQFLPKRHVTYKNVPYLTDEEVHQIRNAIDYNEKGLCLRDKAIILLLLYTGLRACDIASLRLESIDWEKEIIGICQCKTNVPLELPLSTVVGNAIYNYLISERPFSNDEHIFLRAVRPYTALSDSSISIAVDKVCRITGIRQGKGERKGTHIFRHKAATSMLEKQVSRPIISKILGHVSPRAVDTYLHADFHHLKDCALSIEEFPAAKEVFGE